MILAHFAETWPRRRSEWLLAIIIAGLGVVYTAAASGTLTLACPDGANWYQVARL